MPYKDPTKARENEKRWRLNNPEKFRAQQQRYRKRYPEKLNQRSKEWRIKYPEKYKESQKKYRTSPLGELLQKKYDLKRLYRLSIEHQQRMLTEQKGRCKICGKLFSEGHFNKPFIDHSHDTYLVRGILCGACNTILGYSRDNIEI